MANDPNTPNTPDTPNNGNGSQNSNTPAKRSGRRKPRRDGKGSNVKVRGSKTQAKGHASEDATTLPASISNTNAEHIAGSEADDAAIAEGGIKAVGDKKLIPFMKFEKPMAIFSAIMVIVSIIALAVNGLNLGLDFTGGISADVSYEQPVEQVEVVEALSSSGFNDPVVQYLGSTRELLVRLPPQTDSTDELETKLRDALVLPSQPTNTASLSNNINIIGSQVGNEVYVNSLIAIITALVCMLLYVAMRFQFKLAIGALLALFHDAIVTLGIFAIFGFPFDLTVLAAILALIGYSLNDTIVVYDRIRENFRRVRDATPTQIIDLSLTETLRRTFMTITTVLLVVLAMKFLGGAGLEWFSVALLIGLVAGTYSSTYISSSIPLAMGLSRDDFVVKIKPEFEEEVVVFNDPKAYQGEEEEYLN